MRETKFFWIIVHLLGVIFLCHAESTSSCQTPSGHQGQCKSVTECPLFIDILSNRPITPENADLLRRSRCGFHGNTPKLCCPSKQVFRMLDSADSLNLSDVSPVSSDLLPDVCGDTLYNKIIGGTPAALEEFPWMALLEYEKVVDTSIHGFYCGGVLISKRYVLTAGHCLKGSLVPRVWNLVSVRLGELDISKPEDCEDRGFKEVCAPPVLDIPVEEKITHENYRPTDKHWHHDIALLRLSRDVEFNSFHKPICIPRSTEERSFKLVGQSLAVAGWGVIENNTRSNILMKVNIPVKENEECNRNKFNLNIGQLCAGGVEGKDSCFRDSGGPLMHYALDSKGDISWFAVGLVSYGYTPCGTEGYPGVYTKVASYVPWIVSKLRK